MQSLKETRKNIEENLQICRSKQWDCAKSADSFKDIVDLDDIVAELKVTDDFLSRTKACLELSTSLNTEIKALTEDSRKELQQVIQL